MGRRASGLCLLFTTTNLVFAQPGARPGPGVGSHIEAMVHMRQAEAALRRGSVEDAVALYEQAAAEGAPAVVYRELAFALESASRWREAAQAWTRYGSTAPQSPGVTDRAGALVRAEELRRRLSALRVSVSPPLAARTARVWFDHEAPRYYHAGGSEALIEGGSHRVRVESVGFQPFEAMVNTGYGEPRNVQVFMVPLAVSPGPSPETLPRAQRPLGRVKE